jgi:hypothetical protein
LLLFFYVRGKTVLYYYLLCIFVSFIFNKVELLSNVTPDDVIICRNIYTEPFNCFICDFNLLNP